MFISFVLIQKKRTKEKIKASTKFAKILRKNAKNNRLASLKQYHFLNAFFLEFLNAKFRNANSKSKPQWIHCLCGSIVNGFVWINSISHYTYP